MLHLGDGMGYDATAGSQGQGLFCEGNGAMDRGRQIENQERLTRVVAAGEVVRAWLRVSSVDVVVQLLVVLRGRRLVVGVLVGAVDLLYAD
ncbi:hypothetical protein U9M48_012795 [Paspalum notatum var. saurae]|uniref:Uncharacterized protein n=1 Tax=Paspalum notatum var. saurae TaxID=547442 RepID=A0AAQ3SYL4_PASNO